jgi:hypothetical protein
MNTVFGLPSLAGPVSATETAVAAVAGGTTRALFGLTSDVNGGFFDGRPFKIRVVASAVATGTSNLTVNLYWNSAANTNLTTFTGDILVIGSGAQALASKSGSIFMEATLMWDSTLQALGAFWNEAAGLANIVTTPAIIKTSAAVTATNPVTSTGVATPNLLQFFVTMTCSTAANVTSTKLVEAAIDRI